MEKLVPRLFNRRFPTKRHRELTLYLHFPCFDGVASATLAKEVLRASANQEVRTIVPVTYDLRSRWLKTRLGKHAVIVDFLFHPDAEYWADHHTTTFVDEAAAKSFRARAKEKRLLYDPTADSCTSVIWKACGHLVADQKHYEELVKWANKIDAAAYDSVHEAILGEEPALRINKSLFINPDRTYCEFLVGSISERGLALTARRPEVLKRVNKAHKMILRGLQIAEKSTRLIDDIVVLRVEQTPDAIVSRYSPYFFFPKARYSITCFQSPETTKITAMRNPWLAFESIPLGPLFAQFGGGGHQRVASVVLPTRPTTVDQVLSSLLQALQSQDVAFHHEGALA